MLSEAKRATLKLKIEAEISSTKTLISQYEEVVKPVAPDCAIGRVSRMDAIINNSVAQGNLDKAKQKLVKLNIALAKIDQADFGTCTRCKKPIQEGRLLFMPESNLCVHCAAYH